MPDRLGAPRAEPLFDRLTLVGIGLIGSSIARAARQLNLARTIVAVDRDAAVIERVRAIGIADEATADLVAGVTGADHVILCVPVGACGAVAAAMRDALKPGAIVSDVGSVKASVVAQVQPHLPEGVSFVPAHPVAGTEHSGPDAGFATLFLNRWCILTPPEGTDEGAIERVAAFWTAMGSNVEIMGAQHHDLVLAITSHVPHLIAYNIVGTAADLETVTQSEVIKFSAGGFRDFHPHRGLGPHHVARRVPPQQGCGARNARAPQRGHRASRPRDPLGRGRQAARALHPHPRHPPRHHLVGPGNRRARFRPAAGEPVRVQ
jgi:cyclohexadieny/prephenate dehydrogenase